MKTIILILFTTVFALNVRADYAHGEYYIRGKAFDTMGELLKNSKIIMEFNNEKTEVITDENGAYKITVKWESACKAGLSSLEKREEENDRMNPKWILLKFGNAIIKIENEWRKYIGNPADEESVTKILDLKFI